ncbi:hypothetical protein V8V91_27330 [Algoriphagus halophilus]|uniref:hypothetical protein n=1 Tax=Algoriphagus halophilus TaxID=226505 RepID=UPI00358F827F
MKLKIGVYNVEWMRELFDPEGNPTTTGKEGERSQQLAEVIEAMNPDFWVL